MKVYGSLVLLAFVGILCYTFYELGVGATPVTAKGTSAAAEVPKSLGKYFVQCWGGRNSVVEEYTDHLEVKAGGRWVVAGKERYSFGTCIAKEL